MVVVPLIAAGQGLIVGGLVVLGLTVWPKKEELCCASHLTTGCSGQ